MYCSNCGKELTPGAKFCTECGTPVAGAAGAWTSAQETAAEQPAPAVAQETSAEQPIPEVMQEVTAEQPTPEVIQEASAEQVTPEAIQEAVAEQVTSAVNQEAAAPAQETSVPAEEPQAMAAQSAAAEATVPVQNPSIPAEGTQPEAAQGSAVGQTGNAAPIYGQYNGSQPNNGGQSYGQYNGSQSNNGGQNYGQYNGGQPNNGGQSYGQYNGSQSNNGGQSYGQYNGGQPNNGGQYNGNQANNGGQGYGNSGYNQYQDPGQAGGPQGGRPQDGNLQSFALFVMILAGIVAVWNLFGVLGSFFQFLGSFGSIGNYGLGYPFLKLARLFFGGLQTALLGGMAFFMYLIHKKWDQKDAETYMMGAGAATLLMLLVMVLRVLFNAVTGYRVINGSIFWNLLPMLLGSCGLIFLLDSLGIRPLEFLQRGNLEEDFRNSMNRFSELAKEVQSPNRAADYAASGAAGTAGAAGMGHDPYLQNQTGGGPNGFMPVRSDRSLLTYILLSFITCGIYSLFFYHGLAQDVNRICEGDGLHTRGVLELVGFSILTCGIYGLYWEYALGNRLQANAPRYGLSFSENGTSLLLWRLVGSLLCGIGAFVAVHIIIKNTNALADVYNRR